MSILNACIIRISGLSLGVHRYKFCIDKDFFNSIENVQIQNGKFDVAVELDKKADMFMLHFNIDGYMDTPCDRCLNLIQLPVVGNQDYNVKYKSSFESDESDEFIWIDEDTHELDLSSMIYESICLSIPMIKAYECEDDPQAPCDQEVLKRLNSQVKENHDNPIWDVLKGIKK